MTKESRERRESPESFTQRRMWKPVFECGRGKKAVKLRDNMKLLVL